MHGTLAIPGMDISRSLVAVGREFAFPINYSTNHLLLEVWNHIHETSPHASLPFVKLPTFL
jgi:hypothetical protein